MDDGVCLGALAAQDIKRGKVSSDGCCAQVALFGIAILGSGQSVDSIALRDCEFYDHGADIAACAGNEQLLVVLLGRHLDSRSLQAIEAWSERTQVGQCSSIYVIPLPAKSPYLGFYTLIPVRLCHVRHASLFFSHTHPSLSLEWLFDVQSGSRSVSFCK